MTFRVEDSFIHLRREDKVRPEYATYSPPKLLPTSVAPVEKQLRVFVNQDEYTYYDPTLLSRPTSNYWTYTPPVTATGGIACWGIRLTTFQDGGDESEFRQVAVWDGDNELIPVDSSWSVQDEFGPSDDDTAFNDNVFDLDLDTTFRPTGPVTVSIRFPKVYTVSKVGWTSRWFGTASADAIEGMLFEVNVGTHDNPDWQEMGSHLTQDIGNAIAHVAGEELVLTDYPLYADQIIPEEELENYLLTLSVPTAKQGGLVPAEITLSTALTNPSDSVTLLRETRQDRPWVKPTAGSRARPDEFMVYYDQILYIVQELCELATVAPIIGVDIADPNLNDYTTSSQAQFHLNHANEDTYSYEEVELLETIPGSPLDDQHQIVVEQGNALDGTSTVWTALDLSASPSDATEYEIDEATKTITLGAVTGLDMRIRRVTRTDKYWYDPRGGQPGWNSLGILAMQKQARFMIEEACYLPAFYADSPLATSIFPRAWNWFTYVGTQNQWPVPGSYWFGDGTIYIYVNDVLLTQGVDYDIVWPNIVWLGDNEPGTGDTTNIGVRGGGWNSGTGGNDDAQSGEPGNTGGNPTDTVDWPGLDLPANAGISISIGSTPQAALAAGTWEGGTTVSFSQGNAGDPPFGTNPMRLLITVTLADTIPNGMGGFYPVGAKEVWYCNRVCGTTLYRVALAVDADGDDVWELSDEASPTFGCLVASGAQGSLDLFEAAGLTVGLDSSPLIRMMDGLTDLDSALVGGDINNVPFISAWEELVSQANAAATAGVVADATITGDQFADYIDPDTDFTDFDIPAP